jgi:hypothetical protein
MPWKETCALDERVRFVVEYDLKELTMAELCRKYGISRKTGYKGGSCRGIGSDGPWRS